MQAVEVHNSMDSWNCPFPDQKHCFSQHEEMLTDFATLLKYTLLKDGKSASSFKSNVPTAKVKRAAVLNFHKLLQIK